MDVILQQLQLEAFASGPAEGGRAWSLMSITLPLCAPVPAEGLAAPGSVVASLRNSCPCGGKSVGGVV